MQKHYILNIYQFIYSLKKKFMFAKFCSMFYSHNFFIFSSIHPKLSEKFFFLLLILFIFLINLVFITMKNNQTKAWKQNETWIKDVFLLNIEWLNIRNQRYYRIVKKNWQFYPQIKRLRAMRFVFYWNELSNFYSYFPKMPLYP